MQIKSNNIYSGLSEKGQEARIHRKEPHRHREEQR